MPHAAQVAFALFTYVADEENGRSVCNFDGLQRTGNCQQRRHAGRIVGDAGAVEFVAIAPCGNRGFSREDSIDVRAEGDKWRARIRPGADAEHVAQLVAVDVHETSFEKTRG